MQLTVDGRANGTAIIKLHGACFEVIPFDDLLAIVHIQLVSLK